MDTVRITVNGLEREVQVEPRMLLVDYIRVVEGLTGARVGCETSQCGACTVLMSGAAVKSCTVFAIQADGSSLETVEGLSGRGQPSRLQAAMCEEAAIQCGYCIPGMVISLEALLRTNPSPDEAQLRAGLDGHVCRCGGYDAIVRAALRAIAEGAE